ncbi:acyl carrier protein [Catenulispora sp. GP43]|uniref:acyl carrier protein n=1 Tax=Catenulispora sp. GP43 TaxID=3156263 RepID=UPI0035131991
MAYPPSDDTIAAVRAAISATLSKEPPELTTQTRLFSDLALDSTSVIELLMALEDTLNLHIDPDELTPEVFETVGALAEYVEACLAGQQVPADGY